jgi:plastocyanin
MKKSSLLIVAAVIIVLGLIIALITHNSDDSKMSSMEMGQSNSDSLAVSTNNVKISSFNFSPATIKIKKGTKVTWTNQDSVAHTVREADGKDGPKSDNLAKGDSYSFTFSEAGTFKYFCSIHPDMKGTVIVTQS